MDLTYKMVPKDDKRVLAAYKMRSAGKRPEGQLQKQVMAVLNGYKIKYKFEAYKNANEGKRSHVAGKAAKAEGLTAGIADLTLWCNGYVAYVELKHAKDWDEAEKLLQKNDNQIRFRSRCIELKTPYLLAWDVQMVEKFAILFIEWASEKK